MTQIEIRERGSVDIDPAVFAQLVEAPGFWALVDDGILTASHPRAGGVRLHGSRYVGRALVGQLSINVSEKIPGSLSALLSYASGGAFKVPPAEASSSSLGDLAPLLIHAFLDRVSDYVSQGVDAVYVPRREVASLVGGALDVPRTVQLHTRGMKHMAAFTRPVLSRDLPKHKVTLAALREIEVISNLLAVAPPDIAAARTLAQFFTDSQDVEVLLGRRQKWATEARELSINSEGGEEDLLALAGVILSHESFESEASKLERVPRSWFLNLESLFEEAVRRALRALVPAGIHITGPGYLRPPVFDEVTGYFRADPDLVLRQEGAVVAVGDAKYKTWTGLETSSLHHDIYQLLVHAAAHDAQRAFLVFAHDEFDYRHLGKSATGADTWAFAVDIRNPDEGLGRIVALIGLA
jgi:5-methylcytosine-specific restriction endonuclease McrBC regulatory subunit McrC